MGLLNIMFCFAIVRILDRKIKNEREDRERTAMHVRISERAYRAGYIVGHDKGWRAHEEALSRFMYRSRDEGARAR